MTVHAMRRIRPGCVVQDDLGGWQTVVDVHRRDGHVTLVYASGLEEEGPADAPVIALPALTDAQRRVLDRIHAGTVMTGTRRGATYDVGRPFPNTVRADVLRRLAAAGLIEDVYAAPGNPGWTRWALTAAGRAALGVPQGPA